jgi:hypothetical protein
MCKISDKFVKNESNQIFVNICKLNLAYFTSMYYSINWLKMSVKKHALPNYVDKKLQICKMSKLHIYVTKYL